MQRANNVKIGRLRAEDTASIGGTTPKGALLKLESCSCDSAFKVSRNAQKHRHRCRRSSFWLGRPNMRRLRWPISCVEAAFAFCAARLEFFRLRESRAGVPQEILDKMGYTYDA